MKKTAYYRATTESQGGQLIAASPEQKLAWLQLNTEEGFLLLDTDFKVVTFNHSFQKFWIHFAKSISEGDHIFTKVPASRLAFLEPALLSVLSDNKTAEEEIEVQSTDQSLHRYFIRYKPACDEHSNIIGVLITITDITKSTELKVKEREEEYRKISISKKRYELVAKATNDALYEWDVATDSVYWNEGYETLFGHKRTGETMPSSSWVENIHPDEKENLFATVYDAFKNKQTSLVREIRFRCADGSFKTVFDKLIIQYGTDGEPTGIFGAMMDISDLKEQELAIRELNERLNERAAALIASNTELERFAYIVSHDLQEPLRMVSSFLQLLEKKYKLTLDETARQYITYAVDGAERMRRLILDLLEYSRVGTNKEAFVDTDMGAVMAQVLETFSSRIQETGATIKMQLLPSIQANRMQMAQLLQNLVSNSLKYNTAATPEIEIGYEDKGDAWQFFVKDNGIGIEEKYFDKVFVIFQRLHTRNQFSGTGIGLAICKKIAEKHGGAIWIDSAIGKGTTFFFTIKKQGGH